MVPSAATEEVSEHGKVTMLLQKLLVAKRWHVRMQAWEARQAAISSFQACSVNALQAGDMATAVAAAEQTVACLGNADGQKAAEALLMAQSCRAVTDLEALYQSAAGLQASMHLAPAP